MFDKKCTAMSAKHRSVCPLCLDVILKDETIKVYNNAWYHVTCHQQLMTAIIAKRALRERLQEEFKFNGENK